MLLIYFVFPLALLVIVFQAYMVWMSVRFSIDKMWRGTASSTVGEVMIPLTAINLDKELLSYQVLVGKITVGNPKQGEKEQVFTMDMNTFTGTFWLPSSELCKKLDCNKQPYKTFNGAKSQSYMRSESKRVKIQRENAPIKGFIAEDQFKLGEGKNALVVEKQEFVEIDEMTDLYQGYDGIFGLGLTSGAQIHEGPVWTMARQFKVDPVFGIYINSLKNGDDIGKLVFGGKDETLMKGALHSYDVVKTGNVYDGWMIPLDKIVVIYQNGNRMEAQITSKLVVPSPEQEDITLPEFDRKELYYLLFNNVGFRHATRFFKCSDDWKTLPNLAFVMGGNEYVLTPEDYVRQINDANCMTSVPGPSAFGPNKIVLGRAFMKKFYTRFHFGEKQVQIAESSRLY